MSKTAILALASVSCFAALSSSASAAILLPADISIAVTPDVLPLGTLEDSEVIPIASITPGVFSGIFTSEVRRNALGTLDFVYQFTNSPASTSAISRITFTGFAAPTTTDVNFRVDRGGSEIPTTADRSGTVAGKTGDIIGFNFLAPPPGLGNIDPGETTFAFLIRTNAVDYIASSSNVSFINGSVAVTQTFAPAPVPEPTSLAILAIGGIGVFVRRRKKA